MSRDTPTPILNAGRCNIQFVPPQNTVNYNTTYTDNVYEHVHNQIALHNRRIYNLWNANMYNVSIVYVYRHNTVSRKYLRNSGDIDNRT